MTTKKTAILKPLIVILGPTASGKTALAIELAKEFNGEIISADSRQVYRGMDIGTAKAAHGVPHYMIDVASPDEEFTVQDFKKSTIEIIYDIHKRGMLPILAGGTGLYISAVVDNLEIPELPPNKILREKLEKKTNKELFDDLKRVDPQMAEVIDRSNTRRLVRALEVTILSGRPFSSQRNQGKPLFNVLEIGIALPKEELYKRIDERTEEQIEMGLEDEVRTLKNQYGCDISPMQGFVYREMCEYLEGKISLGEAVRKIKSRNKKYAKRQMTWFKRDKRIHWITKQKDAESLIKKFIKSPKLD